MTVATDLPAPPPFARLTAERRIALFLDFDGTLVDLAPAPDAIEVPGALARGLRALAERLDGRLALVSGRSLDDLATHVMLDGIARAGSHGSDRRDAEGGALGAPAVGLPEAAFDALHTSAGDLELMLETKSHGAALHYRGDPAMGAAARDLAGQVSKRFDLAVKHGKSVVELTAKGADKGGAVRAFLEIPPFSGAMPVFVGDDVTDEDGIAACVDAGGFGVLVGDRMPTAARYRLPDVASVYEWLDL
ncbi:trehalose-phosphatase [Pelagerythrobacter sp.]|uniref:trehalose-phosphatase n=1 Tax=Pelagerythrobacter sp. TaxID=2800702 RepID=UPI0035AEC8AC